MWKWSGCVYIICEWTSSNMKKKEREKKGLNKSLNSK